MSNEDFLKKMDMMELSGICTYNSYLGGLQLPDNQSVCLALHGNMFWIQLKIDLSFKQIAVLFNLNRDHGQKQVTDDAIHSVATELNEHFVPQYLRMGHVSCEAAGTIQVFLLYTVWSR